MKKTLKAKTLISIKLKNAKLELVKSRSCYFNIEKSKEIIKPTNLRIIIRNDKKAFSLSKVNSIHNGKAVLTNMYNFLKHINFSKELGTKKIKAIRQARIQYSL